MLIAVFLATQAVTAGLPHISFQKSGDTHVVDIRAQFDGLQLPAVESEIARRAADICTGKSVDWGRFRFDEELEKNPGPALIKVKAYRREFRCVVATQDTAAGAPANWAATASDESDVRRFFEDYYAKRDAGDVNRASDMFRAGAQGDAVTWAEGVREFNKRLGAGRRRVVAVTWYVNPEAADRPGVYAALDFVGDYPSKHIYCGYIGVYRLGAGSYEIVREEQNLFEKGSDPVALTQIEQMRSTLCRGN